MPKLTDLFATNIPASLGTAGQVLTVNAGATAGEWADGGPDLYAANAVSTAIGFSEPTASGENSVAIGDSATAAGTRSTATAYSYAAGTMSFAAAIGNSSAFRGAKSDQSVAIGNNAYVQASGGAGFGSNANIGTAGFSAIALGHSYANGTDSFAAVTDSTNTYGATSSYSVAIGRTTLASANYSIALGRSTTASADYGFAAGRSSVADGNYSVAFGSYGDADGIGSRFIYGGVGTVSGQQQTSIFVTERTTSDATPTAIGFNDTYRHKVQDNSAHAFSGLLVARQQAAGGTASAAWKVEGLIRREANAGTTTLVNSAITVLDNTPSWGVSLSANTGRGGLDVTCTGAASTNIRWVLTLNTSEVTYA